MGGFIGGGKVKDEQGLNVVTNSVYGYAAESGTFAGDPTGPFVAPASSTSIFDLVVATQLYVQGGFVWAQTPQLGDKIEFAVVDKDNVLGLFATYGLTVGVDVLELDKYVRDFALPPWDQYLELRAPTAAAVMPGLYMRAIYINNGANPVNLGVNYMWFEA